MVFKRIKKTRFILQTFFNFLKKEELFEEYFNKLEKGISFRYAQGIPYSSNIFLGTFAFIRPKHLIDCAFDWQNNVRDIIKWGNANAEWKNTIAYIEEYYYDNK